MKPLKIQKEIQTIDDEKEHNKILFDLGILDDMEDWPLYQKQEQIFNANIYEMECAEYFRLIGKEHTPAPIPEIYQNVSRPKNNQNSSISIEQIKKILNKNIN